MKIKLLASDIDGTLVNDEKEILEQTKQDLQLFMKRGGVFVLASGRPTHGIARYIEELELRRYGGYVISYNGARTFSVRTGELLSQKSISPEVYPAIFDAAEDLNLPLTAYSAHDVAVTEKANDDYFKMETTVNRLEIQRVPSLRETLTWPTPKFLITGTPDFLSDAEIKLRDRLKGLPVCVFRSEPFFLEITAIGCDKGTAILELAERLRIDRSETMACGDGFNDITMLRAAGVGVAMENAQTPAKNAADFITLSNNDNGICFALRKFA